MVNTYSYDPWGEKVGNTGTYYNPYQYTGTYLDGDTGMYQMGARYYMPGSGRFTQLDPLDTSIYEANRFAYTPANPVNYTDPSGLHWVCAGSTRDEGGFGWFRIRLNHCEAHTWADRLANGAGAAGLVGTGCVWNGSTFCQIIATLIGAAGWYSWYINNNNNRSPWRGVVLTGVFPVPFVAVRPQS